MTHSWCFHRSRLLCVLHSLLRGEQRSAAGGYTPTQGQAGRTTLLLELLCSNTTFFLSLSLHSFNQIVFSSQKKKYQKVLVWNYSESVKSASGCAAQVRLSEVKREKSSIRRNYSIRSQIHSACKGNGTACEFTSHTPLEVSALQITAFKAWFWKVKKDKDFWLTELKFQISFPC